jgi:hypothetical protein
MNFLSADNLRGPGAAQRWLALALAGVAGLLALALAARQFQPELNSDLLWPQIFAHDLADPSHPLSGWKFGSATFWFPDDGIFLPLYWLGGDSGWNYPLYTVAIYWLLGAMMAWSLAAAGVERTRAALAGFLALDVVLLGQVIPGHAHWLWLVGIPGRHGGNLATGFALLALTLGAARLGGWSRWRTVAAVGVMTLGLLSDALLLFHWIIPLALALGWQARRASALKPVFTGFLRRGALALGLGLTARMTLAFTQWFLFYRLARDWPLPTLIGQTFSQFFGDFIHHGLFTSQWMFGVLAVAAILAAVDGLRSCGKSPMDITARVAFATGLFGLALGWAAPLAGIYWHDLDSFRYLLNWLVAPAWMLALWICTNPARARWLPGAALAAAVLGAALAVPRIDPAKLVFSHPPEALALRDFCAQQGLSEGLADYWSGDLLQVEWDFDGPSLGQIREQDFTYFWCNNVFDYFPSTADGRGLRPPAPQFVILNGLDRARVAEWLGGSPLQIKEVGPYSVALLSPEQKRRASELITTQAEAALQGHRADWLKKQLTQP